MSKDYTGLRALIKIGSNIRINEFLDGKMYMCHLSFFSKTLQSDHRLDRNESIIQSFGSEKFEMFFNEKYIGIADNLKQYNDDKLLNTIKIFSMTGIYSIENESKSRLSKKDIEERYYLSDECLNFGEKACIIFDVDEFFMRFKDAVKKTPFCAKAGPIKYINLNETYKSNLNTFGMVKDSAYKYQREYRLSLFTNCMKEEGYILDIGSIRDIAKVVDTNDFNNHFKFR
ncbi:hypothetical protein BALOs_0736 [Halobacteriovorax sp. BALOs_7]|uniref:hypothetical protein n=1 Tax=Halobacteriovorax sp. BALOs_7 TaxID=2109558 RepID=UPI000EA199A9|nr:hypothetical protein [Halobacteriovorax sp. BALOs_7]AYF43746.1 hypothetical protein BALOs_0736 [Halobacteriovorax sp. BALOs_7]